MRRLGMAVSAVALLGLVACGSSDKKTESSNTTATTAGGAAANTISVKAGLNDPNDVTISVEMYMPQNITVTAGTSVSWTITGPEPHSVTFLPPGQTMPSPESAEGQKLFAPTPAAGGSYDGKSLVNSGLAPQGPGAVPPFTLTFPTAGTFSYQCVIHPQMIGTVTVVAAGQTADTASAVKSRGDSEMNQWLTEGRDAKKAFAAKTLAKDANGAWVIEMGAQTAHTDILAFSPVTAAIKPGDKVTFVNNSVAPHTATFAGKQQVPTDPSSPAAQTAKPGPSPQTLNATDLFNTGLVPPNAPPGSGPPLAARSYTYTVPTAGDFTYVCIFHVSSGMSGTLKVA